MLANPVRPFLPPAPHCRAPDTPGSWRDDSVAEWGRGRKGVALEWLNTFTADLDTFMSDPDMPNNTSRLHIVVLSILHEYLLRQRRGQGRGRGRRHGS